MDTFAVTEGVLMPKMEPEQWQRLKNYTIRPDDVFICGFPRSGTTWAQYILKLLRNEGVDDGVNIDDAVPWLEVLGTEKGRKLNLNVNSAEDLPSPRKFKSHLPYDLIPGGPPHTQSAKYIYIARNPKDVCVSFWHFTKSQIKKFSVTDDLSIIPWDDFCSNFFEGKSMAGMFGGWLNHVLGWWEHRNEANVLFIQYENLKKKPNETVRAIAEFIGIKDCVHELVDTVVSKISFSTMLEKPSVNKRKKDGAAIEVIYLRKGVIGDWKSCFTPEQNDKFEEKTMKIMKEHSLEFDYE